MNPCLHLHKCPTCGGERWEPSRESKKWFWDWALRPLVKTLMFLWPYKKVVREIWDRHDNLYFRRTLLLKTPWFAVCRHEFFQRPDDPIYDKDGVLHNHPQEFWTYVLEGGYEEFRMDSIGSDVKEYYRRAGFKGFVDKDCFHRINSIFENKGRKYCKTLTVAKLERRAWGFLTDEGVISNEEFRKK